MTFTKRELAKNIAKVLLFGVLLYAGTAKVVGDPKMLNLFSEIGVGQWFRFVVGFAELGLCTLIWHSTLGRYAALGVCGLMLGAISTHLFVIGGSAFPAVVLFCLSAYVFVFEHKAAQVDRRVFS